jgi:hypothetical protein
MASHSFETKYTPGSDTPIQSSKTYTGTGETSVDESITASASDYVISMAMDVSQVKSIVVLSDQALVIKTNSNSSPADTLTLVAGRPYEWDTDSYNTFKFGTDITSLHVANPASSAARLQISFVFDASP